MIRLNVSSKQISKTYRSDSMRISATKFFSHSSYSLKTQIAVKDGGYKPVDVTLVLTMIYYICIDKVTVNDFIIVIKTTDTIIYALHLILFDCHDFCLKLFEQRICYMNDFET